MRRNQLLISHIRNYLDGKLELVPKSLGVLLVDLGFLNYQKLTPENYNYWWYEVPKNSKIDKNAFTFSWSDLIPTRKMEWVKEFIQYHKEDESVFKLLNAILNIESALSDGITNLRKQIEIYYGKHLNRSVQIQMNF